MKLLATLILVSAVAAGAQSLGDVARENRAKKRPQATRVLVAEGDASSTAQPSTAGPQNRRDKVTTDIAAETEKQYRQYYERAVEAKKAVEKLRNEVAVLERDRLVQSTNYYMDAGTRLRNSAGWAEQRRKLDQDIATKSKELQAAQTKLEELREEARKAGVPAKVVE